MSGGSVDGREIRLDYAAEKSNPGGGGGTFISVFCVLWWLIRLIPNIQV